MKAPGCWILDNSTALALAGFGAGARLARVVFLGCVVGAEVATGTEGPAGGRRLARLSAD